MTTIPKTPFRDMHPGDGWKIVAHDQVGVETSLHVGLQHLGTAPFMPLPPDVDSGDPEMFTKQIWVFPRHVNSDRLPTEDELARAQCERTRLQWVAEAVCRYYNTGGHWPELVRMLQDLFEGISRPITPEGWKFFDTYHREDGKFVNVWLSDDNSTVVRVVEGESVDEMTYADFLAEQREEDEEGVPQEDITVLPGAEGLSRVSSDELRLEYDPQGTGGDPQGAAPAGEQDLRSDGVTVAGATAAEVYFPED